MTPYCNAHTHFREEGSLFVLNQIHNHLEGFDTPQENDLSSWGIHPWYPVSDFTLPHDKRIVAIGECGLDKKCQTDWKIQLSIFRQQVLLAEQNKLPLIIHCVKAYNEIIKELESFKGKVIFHGFNQSPELAKQLTDQGWYLSFGHSLFDHVKSQQAILSIPQNKILLETDDRPELSIREVYQKCASLLKTKENELKNQIFANFKEVFNYE